MLTRQKLIVCLALALLPASAGASLVYVVTFGQQFGTVDLATGAFRQIGAGLADGSIGLVPGPNGSLLTLAANGNLDAINPATGAILSSKPTGLADCSAPGAVCGPTTANALAEVGGKLYATDFSNNLYTVNAATGATHLIGRTGVPAVPAGFPAFPDTGDISVFSEGLYGVGGKLYTTFDALTVDPTTGNVVTTVIPSYLYQIDPSTGMTTRVAPIIDSLTATVDVNGTFYGFKANTGQLFTLDLANGNTRFVTNIDPAAGVIGGAAPVAPVPEPASIALAGIGIAAIVALRQRRRRARQFGHRSKRKVACHLHRCFAHSGSARAHKRSTSPI